MQSSSSLGRAIQKLAGLMDTVLRSLDSKWFVWLLLGFGAILRIREYLLNNALYQDEAAIALNIINKSVAGLFGPLDANQVAPVGFLLLEKCAVTLLGLSEYSLRLFPILFSLVSLALFCEVARRYVTGAALLFALGLFAASWYLIHYSAQVKQYTGDVAIALAVTVTGLQLTSQALTTKRLIWLASLGALAVWFSHPSVFVLAGVGSALLLAAVWNRDWRRVTGLAVACGIWLVSFALFFLTSVRGASANAALERSWDTKETFMPLPPRSISDLRWFPETLTRFFANPLSSPFRVIAIAVLMIGLVAVYRTSRQRLLLLMLPVLFTLAASGLHKYPFGKRLILFLVPAVILLMASGIQLLLTSSGPLRFVGVAVALLLVLKPLQSAASHARWGPQDHDIRTIVSYVHEQRQPGDWIYFYPRQRDAFHYYASQLGLEAGEYRFGLDASGRPKGAAILNWDKEDLDQLRGKGRVWVVFSNVRMVKGINEEKFMCEYLDSFGRRLNQFKRAGTSAYLYDTTGR